MPTPRKDPMNLRTAAVALGVLLALGGCSKATGTITEKEYESAKTKQTCAGSGTKRTCKTTTTKSACWELELRTDSGDEDEVCVSRPEYDRYQVGQRYP
jgi:outer membrane lipoprotein SlyB